MNKVLIIGPSIDRTKGGIATVIINQLESNPEHFGFKYEYIVSHVDGGKYEKSIVFLKAIFKTIFMKGISIVHIRSASDTSFLRKSLLIHLARFKNVPAFIHMHGADFDEYFLKAGKLIQWWIRFTLTRARKVIVLSRYWSDFVRDTIGLTNVVILRNGVKYTESYSRLRNDSNFLFLGRLGHRKGVYDLLNAIDEIVNTRNYKHLTFFLAGDGDVEKVKEIIERLDLQNNVKYIGWIDSIQQQEIFQQVSSVLLPSYNEGLPMALLEALANGKVVISTTVGGIPELISEGVNGYLVAPGDVTSLVERILNVANNSELIDRISGNNTSRIKSEYDLTVINKQMYSLYQANVGLGRYA